MSSIQLTLEQEQCLLALGDVVQEKLGGERSAPGVPVTGKLVAARLGWDLRKTTRVLAELQAKGLVGRGAPN